MRTWFKYACDVGVADCAPVILVAPGGFPVLLLAERAILFAFLRAAQPRRFARQLALSLLRSYYIKQRRLRGFPELIQSTHKSLVPAR